MIKMKNNKPKEQAAMVEEAAWEEEFNTKFAFPATLWAKNENEDKWYGKKDVLDFIRKVEAQAKAEGREEAAEIFRKETEGLCHAACGRPLHLGYIYKRIIEAINNLNNKTNGKK
jgi:hypothetical protein